MFGETALVALGYWLCRRLNGRLLKVSVFPEEVCDEIDDFLEDFRRGRDLSSKDITTFKRLVRVTPARNSLAEEFLDELPSVLVLFPGKSGVPHGTAIERGKAVDPLLKILKRMRKVLLNQSLWTKIL